MNSRTSVGTHVLVAGAGIGGLAAALALARCGLTVELIEQSAHIGEIGAGLQLAPNAFAALDALGVGQAVRDSAVFIEHLIMMDAIDCSEVARVPVGESFRQRFGNPYAVIHRADLHNALHAAVSADSRIRIHVGARISDVRYTTTLAEVSIEDGRQFKGAAIIGCDGVKSMVRERMLGDAARISGHVVYRAVVPIERMPEDLRINAPVVWGGPNCHLVHYPLRSGREYNLVVTFHSREQETWGVRDGSQAEVLSYFQGVHQRPRRLLDLPTSWRRWSTADREPVASFNDGCAALLGDAAHPMMQYLAQGACMALEDAVTLGECVTQCHGDFASAFADYSHQRVARTARVVLAVREMGRVYHASGVERLVRNSLWQERTPERYYDSLEWLYAWRPHSAPLEDDASSAIGLEHVHS